MSIQFKKIITKYIPGEKVYGIDLVIYKNIEAAKNIFLYKQPRNLAYKN